jgi:NAD(P)-dependent dehydrogenase (short-subunit alcohol dehydrogenase family)
MVKNAEQQIIFITGCSSGFGFDTAQLLATQGYRVYASMRAIDSKNKENKEKLEATAGDKYFLKVIECDVTIPESVTNAVQQVIDAEGRIDVLINNAGYALIGPIELGTEEDVRREFETNVFGYIRTIKAVLPHMRAKRSGRIINIGSVGSEYSSPYMGFYCATKFAVKGISEALLGECYPFNIKVSVLEPSGYETPFMSGSMQFTNNIEDSGEYESMFRSVKDNFHNVGKNTGDPHQVAKKLAWMVKAKKLPFLVPVGRLGRLSRSFAGSLPAFQLTKIMARMYKFDIFPKIT